MTDLTTATEGELEDRHAQACMLRVMLSLLEAGVELSPDEMGLVSLGRGEGINFCRAIRNRLHWMDLGMAHKIWERCMRAREGAMNA